MKKFFKSNITKGIFVAGAVAGVVTGLSFGFMSYNKNSFTESEDYKPMLQTTLEVERDIYSDTDIDEVIIDLYEAFEWQGYFETDIQKMSDDEIVVTHEIKYIEENQDFWSYEAEQAIIEEMLQVQTSLYYKTNVEFRTVDGQPLFVEDANGHPAFNPAMPVEPDPSPASEEVVLNDWDDYFTTNDMQLIAEDGAEVTLVEGNPAIELTPINEAVLNEFKRMHNYLFDSYDPATNPAGSTYVVWFGYDMYQEVAAKLDPEGWAIADSPLEYAFMDEEGNATEEVNDIAEPFLISIDQAQPMLDWETTFSIGTELNSEQAEQTAARINFSTKDYEFNVVSSSFTEAAENPVQIRTMMIVFITIIALAMFAFSWYFGLLGFLNSLLTGVIALGVVGMIAAFAIPLSPIMFSTLAVMFGVMILFNWNSLEKQKEILVRSDGWKQAYGKINDQVIKSNTMSFAIITIMAMMFGVIATMSFGLPHWLLLMTAIISFVSATFVSPAVSIGINVMFGRMEFKGGYNWLLGVKPRMRKESSSRLVIDKFSTTKGARIGIISSIAIVLVGFMVFGILGATTGETMNFNSDYSAMYNYEIVLNVEYQERIAPRGLSNEIDDPQGQQNFINTVEADQNEIVGIIEGNGINVVDTKVQKNNNYGIDSLIPPVGSPQDELNIVFSYGLIIESDSKMTQEQFNAINAELGTIDISSLTATDPMIVPTEGTTGQGYSINQSYSATNIADGGEAMLLQDISAYEEMNKQILGLLVGFIIVMIFLLIFLKWTGAAVIGSSVLLEGFALFAMFPLLFLPFGSSFFVALFATMIMSMVSKSIFTKKAQEDIRKTGKIKESVFNAVSENRQKTFWINGMITGLIVTFSIIGGSTMMPALAAILIGFAFVELSNTIVFPRILTGIERFNRSKAELIHKNDVRRAQDPNVIEEEYVKGVNY